MGNNEIIRKERGLGEKLTSIILIAILVLSFSFFSFPKKAKAANLSGNLSGLLDYSGQDVIIGNVTVTPYNGSSGGWLEVRADNITVTGTINATGAGYGGGGGGGGGATSDGSLNTLLRYGGAGGVGVAGGLTGTAGTNQNSSSESGVYGGAGGKGGGSYGGNGGVGGVPGNSSTGGNGGSGSAGGYSGSGVNGDGSTDENVLMGSGGGAGGGGGSGRGDARCYLNSSTGDVGGGGGGGGGAGNRGGGYVKLIASGTLTVSGSIVTTGTVSSAGNGTGGAIGWCEYQESNTWYGSGGAGGGASSNGSSAGGGGASRTSCYGGNESDFCDCVRVCPPPPRPWGPRLCFDVCSRGCCQSSWGGAQNGGSGGSGGSGAGGGVLLKGKTVSISGSIDTRGGGGSSTNGGTLKIFYSCTYSPGSSYTGRTYSTISGVCGVPPTASIETPNADNLPFPIGTAVSFQARATDSDGTIASHSWYVDTGGCTGSKTAEKSNTGLNTSNSTSSLDYSFSSIGSHSIYYQSQDDSGSLSACVSRTVEVTRASCGGSCLDATQCPGDGLTGEAGKTWTYVDNSSLCSSAECECYHEPEPGACGSAQDETFCAPPTDDPKGSMCSSSVDPTGIKEDTDSNRWTWTCPGQYGGDATTCYAAKNCAWQEVSPE